MSSEVIPEFSTVYEVYHGRVLAYAARLIGRDDADDVAQEVFVKVRRALGSLEDPSKLSAWIHAITLNAVRDAARKRASRGESPPRACGPVAADPGAESLLARLPDSTSRSPEEAAMRSEMVACYLDHVRELRPGYREVYVLSEFEQLPNDEIARRLSLSLGTVKIRLHRARTTLFEQLRRNCQCFYDDRGELTAAPKDP